MSSRRFQGKNVSLAADCWGDDDEPLVILLHGGGQTRNAWGATGSRMAKSGFQAFAVDLRGHGESDWALDGDYSLGIMVDDLLHILRAIGRPAAIVGASLGGVLGLVATRELRSDQVTALVLVDVTPSLEKGGTERIRKFMLSAPDGFASLTEAQDAVARYLSHRPSPPNTDGLSNNLRLEADGRYHWHWDPAFLAMLRPAAERRDVMLDACRSLTAPALLVRGKSSDVVSEKGAREFLALVPHARFADVYGAAHMVAGDQNDIFAEVVIDFLRSVVHPAAGDAHP
jgi:pimeloyl-ACP methyl ester carboxylesterase